MTTKREAVAFYGCLATRCPVNYWPCSVGDRCPVCDSAGRYAGIMVKEPDPVPPAEDGDD